MAKYNVYVEDVSVEAVFNKLGGVGGAKRFLADELILIEKPKSEPKPAPGQMMFYVDIDSSARLPFDGAVLEIHRGSGFIPLERKAGGVYLDGKKLTIFLPEGQKDGRVVKGYALRTELEVRGHNVSAKVLDFCVDHPEFWPEGWKKDAQGNTIYVFFWDDIFRGPSAGRLFVRYGHWIAGKVVSSFRCLDRDWDGGSPAASSTS